MLILKEFKCLLALIVIKASKAVIFSLHSVYSCVNKLYIR